MRNSFLGCGLAAVNCIVQGIGGQRSRIPVITDFAEKSL